MFKLESNKKLWQASANYQEISQIANKVTNSISDDKFCLWLEGDMGAGKTTFTRFFLQSLGLDEKETVNSPTFTLMFEYLIKDNWYAHVDFYRVNHNFSLEEENILGERDYKGLIIEWPSKCNRSEIEPSHILKIINHNFDSRTYEFYRI
jgi:tRNA threonylcarbamoyladenosine biosynthesis protein TsaE